jgi:flagellar biosynthesis protein FlhF
MLQYFTVQAPSYVEAERKAHAQYGDNLTILMHESVKIPGGFLNLFSKEGVKLTVMIPTRRSGIQYSESRKDNFLPARPQVYTEQSLAKETLRQAPDDFAVEKEKVLAVANAGKDSAIREVLAEVKMIKEKLENSGFAGSREEHPTLNRIDDILILNDFSASYRKALLEKARNEISTNGLNNYQAVQDKLLEWIGESIKIYDAGKFNTRPRIMILVGPPGEGKTTTIAKLAANFGMDENARQIRNVKLITIDAYKIGGREQLEKLAACMGVPCFFATDYDEMKKIIALNSGGTDLFLIDTIGRPHRDMVLLGEMKKILDACGTLTDVHLVLAATTKFSDVNEILKNFEAFSYKSVIVTKMDETIRTGNIISALSERAKPISYITNGQGILEHIHKASVMQFLTNLEGFKVNRIKFDEKFPDKGKRKNAGVA